MATRFDARSELIAAIIGDDLFLTSDEVADEAGLPVEDARRLWRSMGFPDRGDEAAFGHRDVEALRTVAVALQSEVLDRDTVFRLSRSVGQMMARLSDWQVSILVDQLIQDVESGKSSSRLASAVTLATTVAPGFEQLMTYVWRRHLAAAATRMEAQGLTDEELLTTSVTVGFADLSRFTALSNQLDDAELARVVESFESRATDLVTSHGGRVIKTLGDAVLYVCSDPVLATRIGLDLVHMIATVEELPDIRVGLATGSVLARLGDVFGPPVNLAARLSQVARANRVLIDAVTADALGDEFETRVLPPRPVKGFGNLAPITVSERRSFRLR